MHARCNETDPLLSDPRVGNDLGGFAVLARVGGGALATVYRARRNGLDVALKVYEPGRHAVAMSERIAREHDALQAVDHPCVARLHGAGALATGEAYIATQWVDGMDLETRLAGGPMKSDEIVAILRDVARGLAPVHNSGVVHRDLKPSNVMLPRSGRPRAVIVDFGHALVLSEERLTDRGFLLGSAGYMAPEYVAGAPLDARADLYAAGVLLYRMLTGTFPFEARAAADVLRMHRSEPVVPPRRRAPEREISEAAEALCMWLLAKLPQERLPSAHVLRMTIEAMRLRNVKTEEKELVA